MLREIDNGYEDGVLANTNEAGTLKTFWNKEKNLTHPVKYHERLLAVEETQDGYHLHLRNYKILLRKEAFAQFIGALAPILPLLGLDQLPRDPVRLLRENDLETRLISRLQTADHEEMIVEVDAVYKNKAGQVLKALGYTPGSKREDAVEYSKEGSKITLVPAGTSGTGIAAGGGAGSPALPDFLKNFGQILDASQLNLLKLKILTLLKLAATGRLAPFRLEDISINRQNLNPAVDLFSSQADVDMLQEMERFQALLHKFKLFFIKPEKALFSPEKQNALEDAFFQFVMEKLARNECVRKIYVLGSSTKGRSGRYKVPFIHFDWAKLNSDFDIYLELDTDFNGPLPAEWEKKFFWQRAACDYYHFGDVGDICGEEPSTYAARYTDIRFYQHLVEGYIFNPNKGNKATKDQWFSETKAKCIFSRDRVGDWVNHHYAIHASDTERFNVASFNRVYRIHSQPEDFVLKIYDSKYLAAKELDRIPYEIGMLDYLKNANLDIPLPVKNKEGRYISEKDGKPAVLFTFAKGRYIAAPGREHSFMAGELLAKFHMAVRGYKDKRAKAYSAKDLLLYWLKAWQAYHQEKRFGTDVALDIARYTTRLEKFNAWPTHCHGDLSVVNYLFDADKCRLIDFQNLIFGPALIDLADGMVEFSGAMGCDYAENLRAFRQGYQNIRSLSAIEEDHLPDLLIMQTAVRQAKLLRLHFGGFGYELKKERILGLREGLNRLLAP